jgi:hypothetical protein
VFTFHFRAAEAMGMNGSLRYPGSRRSQILETTSLPSTDPMCFCVEWEFGQLEILEQEAKEVHS